MKSKAHGKKCLAVGVSETSLDEPESEETGTSVGMGMHLTRFRFHSACEQLCELLRVKNRSCSALTAYATACSILWPLDVA